MSSLLSAAFGDVVIPDSNDVNNDGIADKISGNGSTIEFQLGKADGTYYYVPQHVTGSQLADMNGDGLLDVISVNGAFVSIRHQDAAQDAPAQNPAPAPEPDPAAEPDPSAADPEPESQEQPFIAALEAEFGPVSVRKLSIDDETGEAEFKVDTAGGDTYEGLISADYVIVEINS